MENMDNMMNRPPIMPEPPPIGTMPPVMPVPPVGVIPPPVHPSVDVRLGYAFVPKQIANDRNLYMSEMGLERGTIFPDLDKPLGVYGYQDLGEGCK
ncbi:MAG: spore coat associated protein CotJA [Oscillospiraceae bacterium]|nr:spore coat associated protein CotJA [Oscillospiraceae bacterium]